MHPSVSSEYSHIVSKLLNQCIYIYILYNICHPTLCAPMSMALGFGISQPKGEPPKTTFPRRGFHGRVTSDADAQRTRPQLVIRPLSQTRRSWKSSGPSGYGSWKLDAATVHGIPRAWRMKSTAKRILKDEV